MSAPDAVPVTVAIPITPATAGVLRDLDRAVQQARVQLGMAEQRFHDTVRPLLTEHGIAQGQATVLSDTAPYTLTVVVLAPLPSETQEATP